MSNFYQNCFIFKEIESDKYSDQDKLHAVKQICEMATHNGIKKNEILNGLRWLFNYAFEEVKKQEPEQESDLEFYKKKCFELDELCTNYYEMLGILEGRNKELERACADKYLEEHKVKTNADKIREGDDMYMSVQIAGCIVSYLIQSEIIKGTESDHKGLIYGISDDLEVWLKSEVED